VMMSNDHKAFRLGPQILFREMRQGSLAKTEGDSLSTHVLLSHAGHNLGDVDVGALGPSGHHVICCSCRPKQKLDNDKNKQIYQYYFAPIALSSTSRTLWWHYGQAFGHARCERKDPFITSLTLPSKVSKLLLPG